MINQKDRRINSTGSLDHIMVNDQTLTINGWVASKGAGPVTGFYATVSGTMCSIIELALHLPSDDVRKVYPNLDNSDCCRFMLRVTLPVGTQYQAPDLLLTLDPIFGQALGKRLSHRPVPIFPDPPTAFIAEVGGAWSYVANEFLDYFIDLGGLKPTDSVLDVGCGVGRMAYGLVNYLARSSRYDGFDIIPELITWAQREISPLYPNFQFRHAPIYNSFYNPTGHLKSTEFIFPYEDASFEFVFLTSVFTHMPGDEIRHYMREIRRVLKPGGRVLISCFLLNSESLQLIAAGKSTLDISNPLDDGKVASLDRPDFARGFEEGLFKGWLETHSLSVLDTLYGSWCGRADFVSYQDLLIVQG